MAQQKDSITFKNEREELSFVITKDKKDLIVIAKSNGKLRKNTLPIKWLKSYTTHISERMKETGITYFKTPVGNYFSLKMKQVEKLSDFLMKNGFSF